MNGPLPPGRIVVVDDNPATAAPLRTALDQAGFGQVVVEEDPVHALVRLPDFDPDLVILNLSAPEHFSVLERIRGMVPGDDLPVLVIIADATSPIAEQALRAGAQDFLTGPLDRAELVVRVRHLLRSKFSSAGLGEPIRVETAAADLELQQSAVAIAAERGTSDRHVALDGIKDLLLQAVSHDLRNPIAAILTLTGILAADAAGTQPLSVDMRREIVVKVESSARKMDGLVNDLLDSDPMRRMGEHRVDCDVAAVVRRVLAEVDLGRNHPLHLEIHEFRATVDPVRLERMVDNLLSNADQHVARGVAIWVRVVNEDGYVLISVEDAGPGVAADLTETIFQPFQREGHRPADGLGLGLSLVRRFAELAGGRAWVQDRPDGGASFRLRIPSGTQLAASKDN